MREMRQAVMYTRVSSKDQEREGYSIPAQQALLREYAAKQGFQIVREFVDVETAKSRGPQGVRQHGRVPDKEARMPRGAGREDRPDVPKFQGLRGPGRSAGGLLRCAYDDCLVRRKSRNSRYIYYHCTGGRGKCELPYFREEQLAHRLGGILKNIYVPDSVVAKIQKSLSTENAGRADRLRAEEARLQQRLSAIRKRMDREGKK
jgi:hypothetical protein